MNIVDLFAGPGGWDQGGRLARGDRDKVIGIEWDESACATARAAGHYRLGPGDAGDVSKLDPTVFAEADYLHASPPCQGFSLAGKGKGREDGMRLVTAIQLIGQHPDRVEEIMATFDAAANDHRSALTLEPLRWLIRMEFPAYFTLEQVPTVLPLWEAYAEALRGWGYAAWTGILNAEQYGVPQTRRRAILMARTSCGGPVTPPPPTHSRYHSRTPDRLDEGVLPWVSMAQALEDGRWQERLVKPTGEAIDSWAFRRPSTTVTGSFKPEIIRGPGYRKAGDGPCQNAPGGLRVEAWEAGVLQSFPADYPWTGTKGKQFEQIGNAVPPLLAAAVVGHLIGKE